jgi:hypothetical protein
LVSITQAPRLIFLDFQPKPETLKPQISHNSQALNQEGGRNVTYDVDDGWLYVILEAIQED